MDISDLGDTEILGLGLSDSPWKSATRLQKSSYCYPGFPKLGLHDPD